VDWSGQQAVPGHRRPACEGQPAEKRADERFNHQNMADNRGDQESDEDTAEGEREKRCHTDLHNPQSPIFFGVRNLSLGSVVRRNSPGEKMQISQCLELRPGVADTLYRRNSGALLLRA
jgi:hypothetical protein